MAAEYRAERSAGRSKIDGMWVPPGGGYRARSGSDMSGWIARAIERVVGVDEDNRFFSTNGTWVRGNSERKLEPKWRIQRVSKSEATARAEKGGTKVISVACYSMTGWSPGIAVAVRQNVAKGNGTMEARDGTDSARRAPAELQ